MACAAVLRWVHPAQHLEPFDALKFATELNRKGTAADPAGLEEKLLKTEPRDWTGAMLVPHVAEDRPMDPDGPNAGIAPPPPKNREGAGKGDLKMRTLTGHTVVISDFPLGAATIRDLKIEYERAVGIPVAQQRLIWGGQSLHDDARPSDYGIPPDATLHLVLRLRGGMFHITTDPDAGRVEGSVSIMLPSEEGAPFELMVGVPGSFAIAEVRRAVVRACVQLCRKLPERFFLGIKSYDECVIALEPGTNIPLPANRAESFVFHLFPGEPAAAAPMDEE